MENNPTDRNVALALRYFLEAEPHWVDHDVQYIALADSDEPQPCLSTQAMQAFIRWATDQGFVGKPEKVPGMLAFMARLPELYRSHDAGICNPATCPLCRQEEA